MRQIVYNSVFCDVCKKTLISYHRHDFKKCECSNQTFVDGGHDYLRYGGIDMSKVLPSVVYDDEPYEKVRFFATRGTRGKDGKKSFHYIPLAFLEDDHLQKILDHTKQDNWHTQLIKKEIKYRKNS